MPDHRSPSASSPPAKHADSNVSARRLKKREIDRRCQRQARERTKSHIAYLEGLVENLRKSDTDERSAALMRRLHDTEKERDALAHTLKEVRKALTTNASGVKAETAPDDSSNKEHEHDDGGEEATPSPEQYNTGGNPRPRPTRVSAFSSADATSPELVEEELPKVCDDSCECCKESKQDPTGTPKSLWRYANNTLLEPYQALSPIPPEEDLLAEDMPVRIVLEGWDAVEQQFGLPVSWKILRGIDQNLFSQCAPTERLAVLRYMHLLLQYHRDPTPERRAKLPPWFLARPSQTMPHSYAINYFVWPGLRERFIFQQHKYCSNLFWQMFSDSIEMAWPYDFRDCFAQRWDTGVYQLTPLFQECLSDISRWTMRPDMFSFFPDLRCDIPASTMSPRPVSNLVQMQVAQIKVNNAMVPNMSQNTKRARNEEAVRQRQQQQMMETWNSTVTWTEMNPMFMTSHQTAAPWIS